MHRWTLAILGPLALALMLLAPLTAPRPAYAVVHIAEIHEVMSGFNGSPNIQYVEVNMRSFGQNVTTGATLSAFAANGAFIDGNPMLAGNQPLWTGANNVANSGDGVRWILGTTAFEAASGIQADFEFMPSPGLPAGAGMVCVFESGRDFTNPSQSIDCVAYGGAAFTGQNPNSSPSEAATTGPGDCERSLTRINPATLAATPPWSRSDDASDFALAAPSPQNNAGTVGSLVATPDTDSDGEADCRDNDDDGDGVKDAVDNCRLVPNADQKDNDADLAGAACDPDDSIVDFDADGCADGEELRTNQNVGGRRNPSFFWDFFDTPDSAGNRDKAISTGDISRIVSRFGSSGSAITIADAMSVPPPPPAYHAGFDRTNTPGGDPWDANVANGSITVSDITMAVNSFGHSCLPPP